MSIWFLSFEKGTMVMKTGKLGEGYTGTLCSIFVQLSGKSKITPKQFCRGFFPKSYSVTSNLY